VETLIPADQDPGAKDANVVIYIDRQLTRKYKKLQTDYRQALTAMDRLARRLRDVPFAQLEPDDRTTLMVNLEAGKADKDIFSDGGKAVFEMVLAHAMQGFYGNPRHGGNKDYVSWRMIGVPPMPVRGRQHYLVADTFPVPEKS
jgi:gluconate 2-dehydrogenase gamma chain